MAISSGALFKFPEFLGSTMYFLSLSLVRMKVTDSDVLA